jgi:Transcriptional regulator, AbiEi antitoxin
MPGVRAFDHRCGAELREPPDLALAGLARRQYGVVARRQLVALGLGRRGIDRRRERGRLHLLHRGVYAVGHTSLTQRGRWPKAKLVVELDGYGFHGHRQAFERDRERAPATA